MLRRDKSAFRKHMSAFRDAVKGDLLSHVGTDVGPKAPSSNANRYPQINPGAVRGKRRR
jgi:hypothetical protein